MILELLQLCPSRCVGPTVTQPVSYVQPLFCRNSCFSSHIHSHHPPPQDAHSLTYIPSSPALSHLLYIYTVFLLHCTHQFIQWCAVRFEEHHKRRTLCLNCARQALPGKQNTHMMFQIPLDLSGDAPCLHRSWTIIGNMIRCCQNPSGRSFSTSCAIACVRFPTNLN